MREFTVSRNNLPLGDFLWVVRIPRKYKKLTKKELKKKSKENGNFKEEAIENNEGNSDVDENSEDEESDQNERTVHGDLLDPAEIDFNNPNHYYEYVLDLIIERKTANDLASSIRDGRYQEQKARLKNSGIDNVIYLVEDKLKQNSNFPEVSLESAILHTRVYNCFNIIKTKDSEDTLRLLMFLNNYLSELVSKHPQEYYEMNLMEYNSFSKDSSKNSNLNIRQAFVRQLRTIKGLGIDNTTIIATVFRTPSLLYHWFKKWKDDVQAMNLLNSAKLEYMISKLMDLDTREINLADVIKCAKKKTFANKLKNSMVAQNFRKIIAPKCEEVYRVFFSDEYSN
jgi:ERCC4-type nuclease